MNFHIIYTVTLALLAIGDIALLLTDESRVDKVLRLVVAIALLVMALMWYVYGSVLFYLLMLSIPVAVTAQGILVWRRFTGAAP
ncbi:MULTISPECIES: hypothetical protein [unclassified Burkholderia]|uniref:hypothetical protein n=1 Tax=unclassified Burkholderia TaxID=2613784 RepID=UPI002AB19E18|nr:MULTISPECIES: hypothetical protein [unclassified Burkholderia]